MLFKHSDLLENYHMLKIISMCTDINIEMMTNYMLILESDSHVFYKDIPI